MTATYTMQSFDNLDTIHADVLCPYRLEKMTGGQPTGILMPAPSSSLLTMDPRIAPSGMTEESVDISESSLQRKKMYSMENAPRIINSTSYTLAGKQPVICSPVGTLSGTVSPQTLPRNHPKGAGYVALSPTAIAYTTEGTPTPDGLFLSGAKYMTATYTMQSFDNLDTIHADVLCPYRLEKMTGGQPTGILMPAPSSSLLTMDPRIAPSGMTEESVDISESSLQRKKMYSMENAPRIINSTSYTLAGKQPVICSPVGTLSGTVSPQTLPRNHPKGAGYVALSPTAIAYTTEGTPTPDGLFLSGAKCLAFNKQMPISNGVSQSPTATSPYLIKFAKPTGYLLDSDGSRTTTYTPLNFSMSGNDQNPQCHTQLQQQVQQGDDSSSTNQESSFV
nr:hypothetical transcript [Hymenolepis microstoma]